LTLFSLHHQIAQVMDIYTSTTGKELVLNRFFKQVITGYGHTDDTARYFNFAEQKPLNETEILEYLEAHFNGLPAQRIYLGPGCYIEETFFAEALRGMLKSYEKKEEYEVCKRIARTLFKIQHLKLVA
jgi:hypothetical protein